MDTSLATQRQAGLLVVASVLCLQGGAAVASTLLPVVPAAGLALMRLAFAALLLAVVLRPRLRELRRAGSATVALLGVVVAGDNLLFYVALRTVPLGAAVTLAFLGPLVLAAVTSRTRRDLAGIACAAAGVVLLTRHGLGPHAVLGVGAAVLSGALIAAYVVLAGRVARRSPGSGPLVPAFLAGSLAVAPLAVRHGAGRLLHPRTLLLGAALAVLASGLPYLLEFRAARTLRAPAFALLLCLEPGVGALVGRLVLHQTLPPGRALGVGLVMAGGAVSCTRRRARATKCSRTASLLPTRKVSRRTRRPDARREPAVTTIKASCPTCGEVELTHLDVALMVCHQAPLSYYAFDCPSCADEVRKPADDHVVSLLLSGGVQAQVFELPAEALEPKTGPRLGYDDLLDFALLLSQDDLLAAHVADSLAR